MPDSYQLQNRSGRNMMKTCGMKKFNSFRNHHIIKTTIEITVEKDGKDESIYLFSRRKSQSIDDEL